MSIDVADVSEQDLDRLYTRLTLYAASHIGGSGNIKGITPSDFAHRCIVKMVTGQRTLKADTMSEVFIHLCQWVRSEVSNSVNLKSFSDEAFEDNGHASDVQNPSRHFEAGRRFEEFHKYLREISKKNPLIYDVAKLVSEGYTNIEEMSVEIGKGCTPEEVSAARESLRYYVKKYVGITGEKIVPFKESRRKR